MDEQYYVVRPDGTREGPFDRVAIDLMRTDGRIGTEDKVEEEPSAPPAEEPQEERRASSDYFTTPMETSTRRMSPWVWVLVSLCVLCIPCVALFAALLFPVFAQARLTAKATNEASELKKVGSAVLVYAADYDDKFPPKMHRLDAAWPALASYAQIDMPVSGDQGSPAIDGNPDLSGVETRSVASPQRTYEFFDSTPWYTGKRIVLFVDGHVSRVPEATFQDAAAAGFLQKQD